MSDVPRWWYQPYKHPEHKVLTHCWVWCDEHCTIHEADADIYQDGSENCRPMNWRPIYVGTDDPTEDFS